MPSKQLVELVNNYKKAGIRISFTKSRSQISLYLYEGPSLSTDMSDGKCHEKNSQRTLEFI
jgi:predicted nuclease of restriction endonuclease-like (RecB) superfamily